jgi:hypothetical protein
MGRRGYANNTRKVNLSKSGAEKLADINSDFSDFPLKGISMDFREKTLYRFIEECYENKDPNYLARYFHISPRVARSLASRVEKYISKPLPLKEETHQTSPPRFDLFRF